MRWPMKRILMQCSGATFSVGIFACNSGVPRSLRTKYCISKHISLLLKRVNKWWWWLVGHRDLFHAELKLLILAKLLIYETEGVTGQSKFAQLQHECLVLWNKVVSLEESHARDNADQTTLIYIMDQRIVEIVLYTSLSVSRVSIMLLEVVECSFWQGHQGMGKSHWRRWTQWTNSFWRWTSWRVKRFHLKRNSRCTATP